jgi:hypothetical protein
MVDTILGKIGKRDTDFEQETNCRIGRIISPEEFNIRKFTNALNEEFNHTNIFSKFSGVCN